MAIATSSAVPAVAGAVEWADLFRTPAERGAQRLRTEAGRAGLEAAGDPEWAAHARYLDGDAASAAASFEAALADAPDDDARARLRYNRATALTRAGRYDDAVAAFDELLAAVPDDRDAAANREIARQLGALEAGEPPGEASQRRPDRGGGQGEQGRQGQEAQRGQQGGEAGSSSGRPGAGEAGEGDPDDPGARTGDGDRDGGVGGVDAGERDAKDGTATGGDVANDDAEEAGDDEDDAAAPGGPSPREVGGTEGDPTDIGTADAPLGEREQAIEQWLRRIPDDPSGLLRRKLVQSHRRDWPDVRENGDGW